MVLGVPILKHFRVYVHLRGSNCVILVLPPFLIGLNSRSKECALKRANSSFLRVKPYQEGR